MDVSTAFITITEQYTLEKIIDDSISENNAYFGVLQITVLFHIAFLAAYSKKEIAMY